MQVRGLLKLFQKHLKCVNEPQGVLREPQNKCTDYATFSRISDYSDWITKSAASLVEQPANGARIFTKFFAEFNLKA